MKLFLLFLVAFPFCLNAQDCKIKKTTDPYTKEIRLSTGFITMAGTSLAIEADAKEIDFSFTMDGKEKCFNDASTAVVNYEGTKQKANFKNAGSINCDGFFHIIFRNGAATPTLLQRLSTQKIVSIQFTDTNKAQTLVTLTPEQQAAIMSKADCLIKEAKTLVK
ncbi:MAG: hypothetical protein H7Y42_10055 [Chitinophagaceae bacterium]|nr:hypothetical protein [Chitinophagaceae bacterium]